MSVRSDLKKRQADREPSEEIGVVPSKADESGLRFVVPWRLNTSAARPSWEDLGDASCGSCPVD